MQIDVEDDDAGSGLVALVITVLELLVEALEREAVRRMESGDLSDEEVERVGQTLQAVEAEIERLKREQSVVEQSASLRADLDGLVRQALTQLDEDDLNGYAPIEAETE